MKIQTKLLRLITKTIVEDARPGRHSYVINSEKAIIVSPFQQAKMYLSVANYQIGKMSLSL